MAIDLNAAFEAAEKDFLKFDRVENKKSSRRDIHAFILLNELLPGTCPIVSAAEHDEIYLDANCDELAKVITVEQVTELQRCGVRFDGEYDSLCMFV